MERQATIPEFRNNGHGVKIKLCCASCAFEAIDDRFIRKGDEKLASLRFCTKKGEVRQNYDGCPEWEMKKSLVFLPKGDGTVKSKEYLQSWLNVTVAYRNRMDKAHEAGDRLAEARLRDEYEEYKKQLKSIYNNP